MPGLLKLFSNKCVCLYMYVYLFVVLHPCEQDLVSQSSLYTRIEDYKEHVLNL